ncbi:MAG: RnfABCDGE type electron transport complex subunit B [Synergistaceae bacterium]|nr:RnfABCDGE type electron transport complex subunit B [Synergistaceae bacterium]MBQ6417312.1 RnfABCDGE type electron transport complex subunit B [Synergistaceae bacterium]
MDIMHVMVTPLALMGIMGGVFGVLLAIASIVFRVHQDERIGLIRAALPGANCGGCGYPGCDGYASGVVNEGAAVNKCSVGGAPVAEKIATIMGVEAGASVPMRAFLKCKGTCEASPRQLTYEGIHDCRSAAVIPGGSPNSCPFGCIGLGTCVSVCQFGALSMGDDGLPKVDVSKCVGCGACVENCPKGVFTLVPVTADVIVACNSHWKGPMVKSVCSAGCIGCTLCAKKCPKQTIDIVNDLAVINQENCIKCGVCAKVCPAKCINTGEKVPVMEKSA